MGEEEVACELMNTQGRATLKSLREGVPEKPAPVRPQSSQSQGHTVSKALLHPPFPHPQGLLLPQ